mmetsp:Transcript_26436/g.56112  ORF Transcript_26436/g.56112 Transcript_26436/m.56112 type:complete len:263 (+) Transcript_26436:637-1425(+)
MLPLGQVCSPQDKTHHGQNRRSGPHGAPAPPPALALAFRLSRAAAGPGCLPRQPSRPRSRRAQQQPWHPKRRRGRRGQGQLVPHQVGAAPQHHGAAASAFRISTPTPWFGSTGAGTGSKHRPSQSISPRSPRLRPGLCRRAHGAHPTLAICLRGLGGGLRRPRRPERRACYLETRTQTRPRRRRRQTRHRLMWRRRGAQRPGELSPQAARTHASRSGCWHAHRPTWARTWRCWRASCRERASNVLTPSPGVASSCGKRNSAR